MSILCKLFGHKPPEYAKTIGARYLRGTGPEWLDGINRPHLDLIGECPRCKKVYQVGTVHAYFYPGFIHKVK